MDAMVLDKHLQTQRVANWTINFQKSCMLRHTKVGRFPENLTVFFFFLFQMKIQLER